LSARESVQLHVPTLTGIHHFMNQLTNNYEFSWKVFGPMFLVRSNSCVG
jgi:hypothetical protein